MVALASNIIRVTTVPWPKAKMCRRVFLFLLEMLRDSLSVCLAVFMVQSLNFVAVCEGAAETWAWFCPIFSLQTLFSDSHAHSLSLMLWHFLFSLRFSPSSFWCFTIRKPVSPQRFQSHGKTALSQLQQPKSSCLVNSYLLSTLPTPRSLSVSPPLLSTNPPPSFSF